MLWREWSRNRIQRVTSGRLEQYFRKDGQGQYLSRHLNEWGTKSGKNLKKSTPGEGKSQDENLEVGTYLAHLKDRRTEAGLEIWEKSNTFWVYFYHLAVVWRIYSRKAWAEWTHSRSINCWALINNEFILCIPFLKTCCT